MVIYTITYPPAPYPALVQPDYGSIEPGSPRYPGLIPYPSFVQQAPGLLKISNKTIALDTRESMFA